MGVECGIAGCSIMLGKECQGEQGLVLKWEITGVS